MFVCNLFLCFKDFKCPAFCNLRVFDEGNQFEISAGMVISSNRYGMTIIASPNHLCGTLALIIFLYYIIFSISKTNTIFSYK